ncbi:hypothetical protein RIO-1_5 [Pseudoalteromonas phage RIO-1]|uniref:Uncharacterized protein n=1 Tax=Pseudoalteromonas phage RIO-1 TaxID=1316739 RepID=R4JKG3_9CAUD|nr:hypothetical protein RIO-1_5 [Pseudoalteromonas phage RIO-1]AGK87019.1 hypothetical protein RIO-1_5 [Pseudoalteromonas phage RIO-1]
MQTLVVYLTLVVVVLLLALLIVSVGSGGWVQDYEREYERRTSNDSKDKGDKQ